VPAPAPAPTVAAPPAAPVAVADDGCAKALLEPVSFESGSAQLKSQGKGALDAMVKCLSKPTAVIGHTDNVGGDAANLKLSQARAQAVKAYLVSKGVAADLLFASGEGEAKPIADNATEQGRAQNRRMEFVPK
jgi:OmpA-OmpF porin, OOP family